MEDAWEYSSPPFFRDTRDELFESAATGFVQLTMKISAHFLLGSFVFLLIASDRAASAEANGTSKTNSPGHDELFWQPKVLSFKIEIPAANLEALKKEPKTYVKGTLREGDKVYAQIGIRLKG